MDIKIYFSIPVLPGKKKRIINACAETWSRSSIATIERNLKGMKNEVIFFSFVRIGFKKSLISV